jgi:hypothetical protein
MKIGLNFEWTWVNWTRNIFPNIFGISFKVLLINQGKDDVQNDEEIIDRIMKLIALGSDG